MNEAIPSMKLSLIILIIIQSTSMPVSGHNKDSRNFSDSNNLIRFLCRQGANTITQSDWKSICRDHFATRGSKQHIREQRQPRSSFNGQDSPTFDTPSFQPKSYSHIHSRYIPSQDSMSDKYSLLRRIANSLRQKYVAVSDEDNKDYDRKIEVSQGTDERGYYTTTTNESPLYLIRKWSSGFLGDN